MFFLFGLISTSEEITVRSLRNWFQRVDRRQRPACWAASYICWRRARDSNPRYGFPYSSFQDWRLQPLGHLSGYYTFTTIASFFAGIAGHFLSLSIDYTQPFGKFSTLLYSSTGYKSVDLIRSAWK